MMKNDCTYPLRELPAAVLVDYAEQRPHLLLSDTGLVPCLLALPPPRPLDLLQHSLHVRTLRNVLICQQFYFKLFEIHWSVPALVKTIEYFLDILRGQVVCYAFKECYNLRETQGMVIVNIDALEQFH